MSSNLNITNKWQELSNVFLVKICIDTLLKIEVKCALSLLDTVFPPSAVLQPS